MSFNSNIEDLENKKLVSNIIAISDDQARREFDSERILMSQPTAQLEMSQSNFSFQRNM